MTQPSFTPGPIVNADGSLAGMGKALAGNSGVVLAAILTALLLPLLNNFGVTLSPHWTVVLQTGISLISVGYGVYKAHPDWAPKLLSFLTGFKVSHAPKLMLPLLLASTLLVGACAGNLPAPPATPAPADIATEAAAINAVTVAPADYFNTGAALADTWCNAYLNDLTQLADKTDFAATEATEAGGLATGIAAASGAGMLPMAVIGLVAPAINQSLLAAGRMATAGQDPGVVWQMVSKEQQAYIADLPAAGPANAIEAQRDLAGYAMLCQPAGIRSAVLSAGLAATASAAPAPATLVAPSATAEPARAVHRKHVIIVQ